MGFKGSMLSVLSGGWACAATLLLAGSAQAFPLAYVTNGGDDTVTVINTITDEPVGEPIPVGAAPAAIVASPDQTKLFVTSGSSNVISVINARTRTAGEGIDIGGDSAGLAISSDGSKLYTIKDSQSLLVIDVATGAVLQSIDLKGLIPTSLALSPDGKKAYVVDLAASNLIVVDLTANQLAAPISLNQTFVTSVAFNPQPGSNLAYAINTNNDGIFLINVAQGLVFDAITLAPGDSPNTITFNPDGSRIYVANFGSGNIKVLLPDGTVEATLAAGNNPSNIILSPDSRKAYVVNQGDNAVSSVDLSTEKLTSIAVGTGPFAVAIADLKVCGDGFREGLEICDDGNLEDGDGCSAICNVEEPEPKPAECGNGIKEEGEECDDGDDVIDNACSNECKLNSPGGDGCSLSKGASGSAISLLPLLLLSVGLGVRRLRKA